MTPTTDRHTVRMNDKTQLRIALASRGFLPRAIQDVLEDIVAESIHTFMSDSRYITSTMIGNQPLLTDILDMELAELMAQFPSDLRYTRCACIGELRWMLDIHLEEASAPCKIEIHMSTVVDE